MPCLSPPRSDSPRHETLVTPILVIRSLCSGLWSSLSAPRRPGDASCCLAVAARRSLASRRTGHGANSSTRTTTRDGQRCRHGRRRGVRQGAETGSGAHGPGAHVPTRTSRHDDRGIRRRFGPSSLSGCFSSTPEEVARLGSAPETSDCRVLSHLAHSLRRRASFRLE